MKDEDVHFSSFVIHLADRIDILISSDIFILDQKTKVIEELERKLVRFFILMFLLLLKK